MKRLIGFLAALLILSSCNDSANERTEEKIDSLGNKIGEKAAEVWDSTKSKATALGDSIENRIDRRKGTARARDTSHSQ